MIRRLIICVFIASTALAQTPGASKKQGQSTAKAPSREPNTDAAGNASILIEAR